MNVIILLMGLTINMDEIVDVYKGYYINDDMKVVYYVEFVKSDNTRVVSKYCSKYLWYYDIEAIKSFKYKMKSEECYDFMPGIPCYYFSQ